MNPVSMASMSQECFSCKAFHPLQTCQQFQQQNNKKEVADGLNKAANLQFQARKYEEALRLYSQAILKDSGEAKYYGNRCAVLMMLERYEDGYYDALQAIELNKNYTKVYERAIRCCLMIGEIRGAQEIIKTFKSFHPLDPSMDGNVTKFEKLQEVLKNATQSYKINDFQFCLEWIEKGLKISPKYLVLLRLKASCLEATNCNEEALDLRIKILESDPKNAEFMRDKGLVIHRLGNLHEALLVLEAAATMKPCESDVVRHKRLKIKHLLEKLRIGQEYFITGKLDEAIQTFTEVITADPGNKKFNKCVYELRGEANLHLRYYAAAFTDFSEALKIGEKTAQLLYMRACSHHAMAQYEDCVIDCEASLKVQWTQPAQTLFEDVLNLMESNKKCPYIALGLSKNATIEEIKTAYQNLTMKFHPNQDPNATEEERMKLEWKFEEVAKAYVNLTQPMKKPPTKAAAQTDAPLKTTSKNQELPHPSAQQQLTSEQARQINFIAKELKKASIQPKVSKKKEKSTRKHKDECSVM